MTVEATARRRHATTYGKSSRKPISSFSSATDRDFAHDFENGIWNPRDEGEQWQIGKHKSGSILIQDRPISAEVGNMVPGCTPSTLRPNSELCPPSVSFGTNQDNGLHELLSSDDERQQPDRASNAMARKRRKITPKGSTGIAGKSASVYDDYSLQRHIEVECKMGRSGTLDSPSSAAAREDQKLEHSLVKSKNETRGIPPTMRDNLSKAERVCKVLAFTPEHITRSANAPMQINAHPGARSQSKSPHKAPTMPQKINKPNEELSTKKSRFVVSGIPSKVGSSHKTEDARKESPSSETETYQPSTPPRSVQIGEGITTPRQRELWDRLLTDDVGSASPSNLDLPGLTLAGRKGIILRGQGKTTTITRPNGQETAATTRRERIVDTLHPSTPSFDSLKSNFGEEASGSSSIYDRSESLHTEGSTGHGAITVQASPSANSQGRTNKFQHGSSSNIALSLPPLQAGEIRFTYARQRSYLTDSDLDEAVMLSAPCPSEVPNAKRNRGRSLTERTSHLQSTQDLDEKEFEGIRESQGITMRSIYELREAGSNARLVSELEGILDDIVEKQSVSETIRRSRAIDLVTNLSEPSNCRFFVAQGLEGRLLANVSFGQDLIMSGLMATAILLLLSGTSSPLLLSQIGDARVLSFLVGLLGLDQDLQTCAKHRAYNMSKISQMDFRNICTSLLKSSAWRAGKPRVLSCHLLSLQCLEYLVRQTREAGSLSEVLSAHAIRRIVITTVPPFSDKDNQPTGTTLTCLELAISILESCTISNIAEYQESLWVGNTLERVVSLLPLLKLCEGDEGQTSRILTLRLYLNLTNNSPGLCEDFSTPDVVNAIFEIVVSHFKLLSDGATKARTPLLLDVLILSLGFLINLAESSGVLRQLVLDLRHDNKSFLDNLVQLFISTSRSTAEVRSFFCFLRVETLTRKGLL